AQPPLPEGEGGEQDGGDGEDADRPGRGPLPLSALGDAQDEQDKPRGDEHGPWDVVAMPVRVLALGEQDRGECEPGDAHGNVHEEDPLPGQQVGEDAAQEDAGGGADAADRAPGAERDVALPSFGEGGGQDREGG